MQQVKQFAGDCVIYAAALEAPSGNGFVAAALVVAQDQPSAVEVFRDDSLEDGQVWPDPMEAVRFAARVGNAAASLYAARVIGPVQSRWVHQVS
ncbi:MAG: hypothetical protein C4K60_20015 [Ideonella sp. MAG2]|nr:MAG: hypothetical protein C4K60_20015 [Ideonella sp. MAG2]